MIVIIHETVATVSGSTRGQKNSCRRLTGVQGRNPDVVPIILLFSKKIHVFCRMLAKFMRKNALSNG